MTLKGHQNTLGNIKDPEQISDSLKETPEKIKFLNLFSK